MASQVAKRARKLVETTNDDKLGVAMALAPHHPGEAMKLAENISEENTKTSLKINIPMWVAAHDPDTAWRLARTLPAWVQTAALGAVIEEVAAKDPNKAEHLAQTTPQFRDELLAQAVTAVASNDPYRVERLARIISAKVYRIDALAAVAEALTPYEPDRALQLIRHIRWTAMTVLDTNRRRSTLTAVARAMAPHDPVKAHNLLRRAKRLARRLPEQLEGIPLRASALGEIAEALASLDPDEAWQLAQSIPPDTESHDDAVRSVLKALARHDPDRAWQLAQTIDDDLRGDRARADIVTVLAVLDPERAWQLAQSVSDEQRGYRLLAAVVETLAPHNPERAWQLAQAIPDTWSHDDALAELVKALVANDLDKARQVALAVSNEQDRSYALGITTGWTVGRAGLMTAITQGWMDLVNSMWMATGFLEGRPHVAPPTHLTALARSVGEAIIRF